jgi:hypothetical protein
MCSFSAANAYFLLQIKSFTTTAIIRLYPWWNMADFLAGQSHFMDGHVHGAIEANIHIAPWNVTLLGLHRDRGSQRAWAYSGQGWTRGEWIGAALATTSMSGSPSQAREGLFTRGGRWRRRSSYLREGKIFTNSSIASHWKKYLLLIDITSVTGNSLQSEYL